MPAQTTALIDLPLPCDLEDPIHKRNIQILAQVLPLTARLYVHYFYHSPSNVSLEKIQSIIGSTYHALLHHNIHTKDIVIPPRPGYDPLRSLPDISTLFVSKDHTFVRDFNFIHAERKEHSLTEVKEHTIAGQTIPHGSISGTLPNTEFVPMFDGVVLGGTFDRLHAGHKMMLTVATLICKKHILEYNVHLFY